MFENVSVILQATNGCGASLFYVSVPDYVRVCIRLRKFIFVKMSSFSYSSLSLSFLHDHLPLF